MKFVAFERAKQGTGASRRLRITGRTPGIVYGGTGEPTLIEIDHNALFHAAQAALLGLGAGLAHGHRPRGNAAVVFFDQLLHLRDFHITRHNHRRVAGNIPAAVEIAHVGRCHAGSARASSHPAAMSSGICTSIWPVMKASKAAREYVQWASEKQREVCGISELWVSTKCGESDTTSGCGANPTVGNAFDKLYPHASNKIA